MTIYFSTELVYIFTYLNKNLFNAYYNFNKLWETSIMQAKRKLSEHHDVPNKKQRPQDSWGVIESISLKNFMCHSRLTMRFPSSINFVVGHNGSGKSAVLTAIIVGLGGKASSTSRGTSLKTLIKTGASFAVIEISLRNNGDDPIRPDVFGTKIVIERRITSDGQSTYKLKSESGKVISLKKEDLLGILDELNLHVDNPLTCLNQEMSKNFLHSKNENDKYKFFLKSTQLEQMSRDYRYINEQQKTIEDVLKRKEKMIPEMEKEVLDKEQRFKDLATLQELRSKVDNLKSELAWSQVAQLEHNLKSTKKDLERESIKTPKYDSALRWCGEKEAAAQQKFNELQKKVKDLQHQTKSLEPKKQESKKQFDDAKANLKKAKSSLARYSQQKKESIRERGEVEKRIEELTSSAKIDIEEEKRKRDKAISDLQEKEKMFHAQLKSTSRETEQFKLAVQQSHDQVAQKKQEETEFQQKQRKTKQALSNLSAGKKNRLQLFGAKMPEFVQKIEEAYIRKQFSRKPRGPIGACLTVRDTHIAVPVECAIRNFIHSFVVDNHEDEKLLESLRNSIFSGFDRSRIAIYTMQFQNEVYDVTSGKVRHPVYSSVLDLLKIDDPVVANCLIDLVGIESILVIPDNQNALETMQHGHQPVNCTRAYTGIGDEVYPDRFYSNNKEAVSRYLKVNVDNEIRRHQHELGEISAMVQHIKHDIESCIKAEKRNRQEQVRCEKVEYSLNEKLKQIRAEIRGLKATEDPQPFDVKDLEDEVNNYTQRIQKLEQKIEKHKEESQKCSKHTDVMEQEWEMIVKTHRTIVEQAEDLTEKINQTSTELEHAKAEKSHYQERKKKHLEGIETLRCKIAAEQTRIEDESKKAAEICAEKIITKRTPRNIENEIKQIYRRIQAEEATCGDHEAIVRDYDDAKQKFKDIKKHIRWSKKFLTRVNQYLQEREEAFCKMRSLIAMRCTLDFDMLLSQRGFKGKMRFDHDDQLLSISVKPHEDQDTPLSNDLRALSGGERSFSTVCYILALWQAIESPLRCLDEFDVFMDMANRRVAMEMMVEMALVQKQKQFIFLTPHDISALPKSSRIHVWKMADPERGQTHLPFERA